MIKTQFIKYRFKQELQGVEILGESCINAVGCTIVVSFNLKTADNDILIADITYPVEMDKAISVCEYQNVFWCKPGFFIKNPPIIIVDLEDDTQHKYRIKGCVKDTQIEDERVSYTIDVSNCNCIFSKLLNNESLNAAVTILPHSSVDSFGLFQSGNHFMADKFSI